MTDDRPNAKRWAYHRKTVIDKNARIAELEAALWVQQLRADSWQARAEGLEVEGERLRVKVDAMADEIDADAFDA